MKKRLDYVRLAFYAGILIIGVLPISIVYRFSLVIYFGVFFGVLFAVYKFTLWVCYAVQSKQWPFSPATEIHVEFISRSTSSGGRSKSISIRTNYTFLVGLEKYSGNNFRLPIGYYISEKAMKVTEMKYHKKDGIPIFYKPGAPWISVIEPGISLLDIVASIMVYGAAISAIVLLLVFGGYLFVDQMLNHDLQR